MVEVSAKPRFRVAAGDISGFTTRPSVSASALPPGDPWRSRGSGSGTFEAAGQGRRLRGFNPSKHHVNVAVAAAGPTLVARARWLYENDGYAGNAVDEWTSAAVGDGIKPRPKTKDVALKRALLDLFFDWTEEADADGQSDYYGLQEKAAREAYLAGESFIRMRPRRVTDMLTVPFQLQVLPSEMLDPSFNAELAGGGYIRQGIEFSPIGKRVAYHFWAWHPYDDAPKGAARLRERVRVDAKDVIHLFDGRQGGQIRGVPRVARVLVKLFTLEVYDDAELERKKTAAMFAGFLIGRGDNPISDVNDDDDPDYDGDGLDGTVAGMQPGAIIDLGDEKDIKFATPSDNGANYDPFQYRTLTKVSAGLGVPYAYMTGDVTKGNFSNVRTDIVRFRRRVAQWQFNTLIFQLCSPVWRRFVDLAVAGGYVDAPNHAANPLELYRCEHLPPRQEWIDPAKDVKAERDAVRAGFKSRTQSVAERGYDVEELDEEIAAERTSAAQKGLIFDSDAATDAPNAGDDEPDEDDGDEDGADKPKDARNEA